MSLAAELLLAQLGVDGILSREPIRVRPVQVDRSDVLARKLTSRARAFATATTFGKYEYSPPTWKYRDVLRAVNDPVTESHFADAEGLPDSLRIDFQEAATQVLRHLKATIPVQTTTRAFGVDVLDPSDSAWATYCRTLRLANDPSSVLDLMEAGTLLPSEAQDLRAMYPSTFDLIAQEILATVVEVTARKPEWRMDWRRELICARYASIPGVDPALAARLQETFKRQQDEGPAPSGARASKLAQGSQTQTQRQELG